MSGEVFGQQGPGATTDEYNTTVFAFNVMMQAVQTGTMVKVVSCTNDGNVSPIGRVVVQPLVNQSNGDGTGTPHGQLHNALYARPAAGTNAIIMDPQPNDIGFMGFCSRDISGVVAAMGQANPASKRVFDWADGVFISAVPLGITPAQYIAFVAGIMIGASIVSTTGNLSVGTGANAVSTDTTGQTLTFQNGILVNVA